MTADVDAFLAHHGVKGMKWGVRRDRTTGVRPIAQTLNDSKFGKLSKANLDRYNRSQSAKEAKKVAKKAGVHSQKARGKIASDISALSKGQRMGAYLIGGPVGLVAYAHIKNKSAAQDQPPEVANTIRENVRSLSRGQKVASWALAGPVGMVVYADIQAKKRA